MCTECESALGILTSGITRITTTYKNISLWITLLQGFHSDTQNGRSAHAQMVGDNAVNQKVNHGGALGYNTSSDKALLAPKVGGIVVCRASKGSRSLGACREGE